ncbi:sigma-70 family RNA polymerase sigma factor, partial [Flavonifractor plautii]|uniref:RNA polymerase sigma factor n=2 Tax=Eubacteriales TaxID=186802 RepID=UPI00232CC5A2
IIVKRTALDLLKQEKRLTSLEDGWDPPAGSGPETETAYHRLVELIRSMPDTYREVLELRCVLEWSNKDIARRLSLSENAVAVRLMRGKALLQNKLEQEGYGREGFGI